MTIAVFQAPHPLTQRRLATAAGLVLSALLALAAGPAPARAAGTPDVKIDYVKYTLPNGLDVILHEDHTLPIVGVNLWYHVGPANEEAGRTGFAHLFEHIMYKGSAHVADGQYFKILQGAGASFVNGSTDFDRTNYLEDVPSNQLELALWLESDRMGFLLDDLDQYKLSNQQDVVRNERRQSIENANYGLADEELYHQLFPKGHPYYADVMGSHQDIQAAKLADVRDFFKRYYCPNNASLAISGDIDIAKTKALVEKYFGSIPRGADVPPIKAVTPPITKERRATVTDAVSLARVYMGWITPAAYKPGQADGTLAADILAGGRSSRLYKKLVYELQIAQDVSATLDPEQLGSVFRIDATARPGHTVAELEKAIDAEVARLAAEGPTPEEVAAAQQTLYLSVVSSLERVGGFGGVANRLNQYNQYLKNPGYLDQDLARFAAATPATVQAFVKEQLGTQKRAVVECLPGKKVVPPGPPTPPTPERTASKAVDREPWRQTMPAAGLAPAPKLPTPTRFALSNGLTVYVVENSRLPIVTANLVFRSGSASDPPDLPGLAGFTASMLEQGTTTRDALAIADQTKALGARLSSNSGTDNAGIALRVLSANAAPALGILADLATHPAFPAEEIERERKDRLTSIVEQRDSPQATARRITLACLYGPTHPYGHVALGTEEAIKKITREDMQRFYGQVYTPKNAALVLAGNVTEADARRLATEALGGWTGNAPEMARPAAGTQVASRVVVVDKPGSPQTQLVVTQLAIPRSDPDFDKLSLMNTVLGGAYGSRINMNLREAHGYTYGAYCFLSENRGVGPMIAGAGVRTDVTGPAVSEILKEMQGMKDRPVTDEEMERAKGQRIQGLPGRFETTGSVADQVASLFSFDLPDDYYATLPARLDAITKKDLADMAAKYLAPDRMLIVAVGDRAKIEPQLKPLNLGQISLRDADGNEVKSEGGAGKTLN